MMNGLPRPDCKLFRLLVVAALCSVAALPVADLLPKAATEVAETEGCPKDTTDTEQTADEWVTRAESARGIRTLIPSYQLDHPQGDHRSPCLPSPFDRVRANNSDGGFAARLRC